VLDYILGDLGKALLFGWFVNSFQAIAPLTAHEKGVHFLGEHISLKN
jgi:hypothetical protein